MNSSNAPATGPQLVTDKTPTPAQIPSATYRVNFTIEGFPVEVESTGNAQQLRALINRLKEIGATPPASSPIAAQSPSGPPMCPDHNRLMKESDKAPGTFYCSKKTDSGYCKRKA